MAVFCVYFRAVDAGITVMNEVGVDPGIDHLLAMQCFDEAEEHGGRVSTKSIRLDLIGISYSRFQIRLPYST